MLFGGLGELGLYFWGLGSGFRLVKAVVCGVSALPAEGSEFRAYVFEVEASQDPG